jgi:hypothetical protein
MKDKPKSGMSKKRHTDEKEDKKLIKKMVKKPCMK